VPAGITDALLGIEFPNFKDAVANDKRHCAYLDAWHAIAGA
jgi:hypothetical protein